MGRIPRGDSSRKNTAMGRFIDLTELAKLRHHCLLAINSEDSTTWPIPYSAAIYNAIEIFRSVTFGRGGVLQEAVVPNREFI